jgi:hypothetical protein
MESLNYYTITPCCPELGTQLSDFRIPGVTLASGVYIFNGEDDVINGISFLFDYCYTIINGGPSSGSLPNAPIADDFSITEECLNAKCEACDPALPVACEVYACCDATNIITLNISDATISTNGVYSYDGSIPAEFGGFTFEPGACYKITFLESSIETTGPLLADFLFQGNSCENTENCPSCSTVEQYLRYASCCGNTVLYFRPYSTSEYFEGVYEYLSTPVNGLENICYSLTIQDVGVAPINNITDYGALPEAPPFIEGLTFDTKSDTNTDCADFVLDCATCKKTCYTLYNCDGSFINTTADLSDYVDTFITIFNTDGPIDGTWYVLINSGTCNNAIEDIQVDPETPLPCECRCFEITGIATSITYINCDGDLTTKASPSKFCSFTYPFVTGTAGQYEITEGGPCVDNVCPLVCYKLTNCDTTEVIYSTLQSLSQYVNTTSVVTLSGYDGCWTVTESVEECDCPVNVIVLQTFDTCGDCLPIIAYKLTSCENSSNIKYTYDDLSEYIDQIVKADCGCYLVELIDFQPPSLSTISIITSFTTCVECLRQYYILEDCNEIEDPIYTYTDLSIYLGEVIKIKGCDTCWTPAEVDIPINPGVVTVEQSFEDCPACAPVLPCLCTRRTNYSTTVKEYQYIDCNGDESVVITLQPNESTGKLCVGEWRVFYPETDNLEVFGECDQVSNLCYEYDITIGTDTTAMLYYKNCNGTVESQETLSQKSPYTITICGVNNQTSSDIYIVGSGSMQFEKTTVCDLPLFVCPITTPKRKVKPGYSTPSCDIEKYEKITCRASEIYYKQVMRLRYGISNCCPEDEEKWLIKKELIDLQALVDPDYICTPVTSCCGQTLTSCGCGCNQTLKTCNSQ